jgi:hypothetical protein
MQSCSLFEVEKKGQGIEPTTLRSKALPLRGLSYRSSPKVPIEWLQAVLSCGIFALFPECCLVPHASVSLRKAIVIEKIEITLCKELEWISLKR